MRRFVLTICIVLAVGACSKACHYVRQVRVVQAYSFAPAVAVQAYATYVAPPVVLQALPVIPAYNYRHYQQIPQVVPQAPQPEPQQEPKKNESTKQKSSTVSVPIRLAVPAATYSPAYIPMYAPVYVAPPPVLIQKTYRAYLPTFYGY